MARLEEAVVLEAGASLRLFGGPERLVKTLQASAAEAGLALRISPWAESSLAALACLRTGALTPDLDALPLTALSAVAAHQPMLERLGCRKLGDVRRLPRPALARRFGPALLRALDQAYGRTPEAHSWLELPEHFEARLELPFRIEQAPDLHHHAESLLRQLCAWLAARHAGVQGFSLGWAYDAMRPRDSAASGELCLHTAEATRDFAHLSRLLAEHLARTELQAPAGEIKLTAEGISPRHEFSASLLVDALDGKPREALGLLLERLSVRLGPECVRSATLKEDHRLDAMQAWTAWPPAKGRPATTRPPPGPQPSWLLDPPLRLQTRQEQPIHHGPLLRITGPHRVESGWWQDGQQRDYYLFFGAACGLLWVYHERLNADEQGWFLHGVFA
ncbi:MAG: DNA polymerase Y family protein [Paucibacter sp.]|nr:DNA polymerase Y family protein [Roseateles sp.]